MKVVCIYNVGYELELTVGKSYDLLGFKSRGLSDEYSPIRIINDIGDVFNYDDHRFISIDDFREIKLKELGI